MSLKISGKYKINFGQQQQYYLKTAMILPATFIIEKFSLQLHHTAAQMFL